MPAALCTTHVGSLGPRSPWPWGTRVFGTRIVQGSLSPWIVPSPQDAPIPQTYLPNLHWSL